PAKRRSFGRRRVGRLGGHAMIQAMEIPQQIGAYRLITLLGKGQAGVVYPAVYGPLSRPVALEVARFERPAPDFPNRFLRAMEMVSRLDHPNIASVLDAGRSEAFVFCAMRFMTGGDLGKQLQVAKRFSENKSLAIAWDVAQGLAAAHRVGM